MISRYSVYLVEDQAGLVTAHLLDAPDVVAVAPRARDALAQLKEYFLDAIRTGETYAGADLEDAVLFDVDVRVRPAYRTRTRFQPSATPMTFRVTGAQARRRSDALYTAALPLQAIRVDFPEPGERDALVRAQLAQLFEGREPAQLARHLPPKKVWLDELVIRVPTNATPPATPPCTPALAAIAEPAVGRGRAKRPRAWERDAEVARVAELVTKRVDVLVVGPAGAGKSTVIAEALRRVERVTPELESDDAPVTRPVRHWVTSAARVIAGMKYLGEWQGRCAEVVEEIGSIGGALVVENLLELVRVGGADGASSVAAFWLPYMMRGELQLITEATPEELDAARRLLPGLVDLFQIVRVDALEPARTVALLGRIGESHRRGSGRAVGEDVPALIARLYQRFMPYDVAPGPHARFLSELIDQATRARSAITAASVRARFVQKTGLPDWLIEDDRPLTTEAVAAALAREVIQQEAACRAVARVVTTFKAGLNDPNRPVGVHLFSGPTGVGKTELAKALARYLFGHGEEKDRLVRLDMSEYGGYAAADRLLGTRGEPSEFLRRMRRQPFAVVLFDEIEKAHPEVFDVLLSLLDEGRITDAFGRVTSFRSCIVIMTSNLGASARRPTGFGAEAAPGGDAAVRAFFRPEFYNRLDGVVEFAPLTGAAIATLTERELARVAEREGLAHRQLALAWSPRVVEHLAALGTDRRYGARPLQRAVETLVVGALARWLLAHPGVTGRTLELELDHAGQVAVKT